ncbi:MAG TPA: MlaD family protein [Steroidobacteraceae bacterium]|nr:MlaD family protein [Steroidobacteraceae bacterium]
MDREANYVAVGAFVLLVLAMAAGFVLWYSDTGDRRDYRRYEIYFDGSVFGLSEGGSVRYLGVAVGRVARIGLDPRDPGRVRVIAEIAENTPVEEGTIARLALQGVTGLLFVDLRPRDPAKPRQASIAGIEHPVIPSEQSDFDVFVSSLPDVVAKAGEALNRVNAVLSDANIEAVTAAVGNVSEASGELPETVADARAMFAELRGAAAEMKGTAANLRELTATSGEQVELTVRRLHEVADNVASTTARLDRFIERNEGNLDRFADQGLAEFEQLLRETRQAVRAFEELSQSLEQDPSRLVYKPAPAGVEIPP